MLRVHTGATVRFYGLTSLRDDLSLRSGMLLTPPSTDTNAEIVSRHFDRRGSATNFFVEVSIKLLCTCMPMRQWCEVRCV